MTNSERAAADQRLMDAMRERTPVRKVYGGQRVTAESIIPSFPINLTGFGWLKLEEARTLHRELGEALAAIEAQFGEKPTLTVEMEVSQYRALLKQSKEELERLRAMTPAEKRKSWINDLIVPEPVVPPKCTGPGAPCGCSIHFTPGKPFGEAFTMNYPKPEDAPGTRETIWGSWSDNYRVRTVPK